MEECLLCNFIEFTFAVFLQNNFPEQHLWRSASGHYVKKQGKQG